MMSIPRRTIFAALIACASITGASSTHAGGTTWLVRAGYDAFAAEHALTIFNRAGALRSPGTAAQLAASNPSVQGLLFAHQQGGLNIATLPGGVRDLVGRLSRARAWPGPNGGSCGVACDSLGAALTDIDAAARSAASQSSEWARVLGYDEYTLVRFEGGEFSLPTRDLQPSHRAADFSLQSVSGPLLLTVSGRQVEIARSPLTDAIVENRSTQILVDVVGRSSGPWTLRRVWLETPEGWIQLEQAADHSVRRAVVGPPAG